MLPKADLEEITKSSNYVLLPKWDTNLHKTGNTKQYSVHMLVSACDCLLETGERRLLRHAREHVCVWAHKRKAYARTCIELGRRKAQGNLRRVLLQKIKQTTCDCHMTAKCTCASSLCRQSSCPQYEMKPHHSSLHCPEFHFCSLGWHIYQCKMYKSNLGVHILDMSLCQCAFHKSFYTSE